MKENQFEICHGLNQPLLGPAPKTLQAVSTILRKHYLLPFPSSTHMAISQPARPRPEEPDARIPYVRICGRWERVIFPFFMAKTWQPMINLEAEPIFAIEVVMAGIPLPDSLEENSIELMESGYEVCVHGDKGRAEMTKGTAK